jgi:hypothetical protein
MNPDPRPAAGRHGIRYSLLEPLTGDEAHFTFQGPFEGQTVTWDARLMTLARVAPRGAAVPADRPRPFIEIGAASPAGRAVTVALDLPRIDEPAILSTIIMIRQYKRLRRGRHEFGASRQERPAS